MAKGIRVNRIIGLFVACTTKPFHLKQNWAPLRLPMRHIGRRQLFTWEAPQSIHHTSARIVKHIHLHLTSISYNLKFPHHPEKSNTLLRRLASIKYTFRGPRLPIRQDKKKTHISFDLEDQDHSKFHAVSVCITFTCAVNRQTIWLRCRTA